MRISRVLMAVLCASIGGGLAVAENRPNSGEISVFGGAETFDQPDIDNASLYGLRFGWNFTDHVGFEIYYDTLSTEIQSGTTDLDIDNYGIDFLYSDFVTGDKHVPYLLIGVGTGKVTPTALNSDYDYWEVGLGYRYFFNRVFGLRIDGRALGSDDSGDIGVNNFDIKYTLGVSFVFGGRS